MTEKLRVLIVEARFYSDLADEMAKGAIAALDKAGILHDRVAVPGTFEVPAAIRFALAHAGISCTLVGFGAVEQVEEAAQASELGALPPADLAKIEAWYLGGVGKVRAREKGTT